ncbi:MAG: hypothetical protein ABSH20_29325, partial [Tepidisphaeraceae bacterium]
EPLVSTSIAAPPIVTVPAAPVPVVSLPAASVPPTSVPVESPSNWFDDEKPAEPAPAPPRFKSEEEDEEAESAESDEAFFFSSSRPAVETTVTVATSSTAAIAEDTGLDGEQEPIGASANRQFDDRSEGLEPVSQPGDYAADFGAGVSVEANGVEHSTGPVTSLFSEGIEEQQRDLDVPAFMRRLQF